MISSEPKISSPGAGGGRPPPRTLLLLLAAIFLGGSEGCRRRNPREELRIGFFPNLTHAQALTAQDRGTFARALPGTRLRFVAFNAGPSAMEALFADSIDLAYVGPSPTLNAFVRSGGRGLRLVAGAMSGGAGLVARPGTAVRTPRDLVGKKLLTPQLGNTQDVSARAWLLAGGEAEAGLRGRVQILPAAPADGFNLFRRGEVDAAWLPEPWLSRYVIEAGGLLVLDERTLWPDGGFATTGLVASARLLKVGRPLVRALLGAHVEETDWIAEHPEEAKAAAQRTLDRTASVRLAPAVLEAAWGRVQATVDPMASSIREDLERAKRLGFLPKEASAEGLFDLADLNLELRARGKKEVRP